MSFPSIATVASHLSLRVEKNWPAIGHLPAMGGFTILAPGQPEHGQTFYIPLPELTAGALALRTAEEVRKFRR